MGTSDGEDGYESSTIGQLIPVFVVFFSIDVTLASDDDPPVAPGNGGVQGRDRGGQGRQQEPEAGEGRQGR